MCDDKKFDRPVDNMSLFYILTKDTYTLVAQEVMVETFGRFHAKHCGEVEPVLPRLIVDS